MFLINQNYNIYILKTSDPHSTAEMNNLIDSPEKKLRKIIKFDMKTLSNLKMLYSEVKSLLF